MFNKMRLPRTADGLNEKLLITFLLVISAIARVWGLGFSHFYGDETKTLYLDKTIPASVYFLDQRKGPMQFFITWVVEKLSGGYDEFWIRFPFALAGILSVLVFYILVKKLFDIKVATVAAVLYSFNGFSVAFSRTAQYQSPLILFGLSGMFLFLLYRDTGRKIFLILAALLYTLAFYCHYDAVFYLVPVLFFVKKANLKEVSLYFAVPIITLMSIFYIPYVYKGYFASTTLGYLSRRLSGSSEALPNSSLYTFSVYNPFVLLLPFLIVGAAFALTVLKKNSRFMLAWFLIPFVVFELVFKSPGTHILHYYLPVYILSALGWVYFTNKQGIILKRLLMSLVVLVSVAQIFSSYYVFIPTFGANYPWISSKLAFLSFPQAQRKYQLFLYGFPYNRGWSQISEYLNVQKGARGFYTNDNTVVAKYYVKKLDITIAAPDFYPQYYVYVYNNQEFKYPDQGFLSHYSLVQKIDSTADIYKRTAQ